MVLIDQCYSALICLIIFQSVISEMIIQIIDCDANFLLQTFFGF